MARDAQKPGLFLRAITRRQCQTLWNPFRQLQIIPGCLPQRSSLELQASINRANPFVKALRIPPGPPVLSSLPTPFPSRPVVISLVAGQAIASSSRRPRRLIELAQHCTRVERRPVPPSSTNRPISQYRMSTCLCLRCVGKVGKRPINTPGSSGTSEFAKGFIQAQTGSSAQGHALSYEVYGSAFGKQRGDDGKSALTIVITIPKSPSNPAAVLDSMPHP